VVGSGLLAGGRRWWAGRDGRRAVRRALDEVGLAGTGGMPVTELSGGQHRRVLIARALVSDPEILLLDEPTAGVDRTSVRSLVATMTGLRAAGRTMLVVTHELHEVSDVVDRVVSLVDGTVVEGAVPGRPVGGH
jgi:zinc transport system ATP-binding protein